MPHKYCQDAISCFGTGFKIWAIFLARKAQFFMTHRHTVLLYCIILAKCIYKIVYNYVQSLMHIKYVACCEANLPICKCKPAFQLQFYDTLKLLQYQPRSYVHCILVNNFNLYIYFSVYKSVT